MYLQANCRKRAENLLYKTYVTEALKNLNESVTRAFTGSYMTASWYEMLEQKPTTTETAEEIIERIGNGLEKVGGQ